MHKEPGKQARRISQGTWDLDSNALQLCAVNQGIGCNPAGLVKMDAGLDEGVPGGVNLPQWKAGTNCSNSGSDFAGCRTNTR